MAELFSGGSGGGSSRGDGDASHPDSPALAQVSALYINAQQVGGRIRLLGDRGQA